MQPSLPPRVYFFLLFLDLGISPDLISRIASTGAFDESPHRRPNHVILNEVRFRHRISVAVTKQYDQKKLIPTSTLTRLALHYQYLPGQGIMVRTFPRIPPLCSVEKEKFPCFIYLSMSSRTKMAPHTTRLSRHYRSEVTR
jgi:hypothetical protein